MEKNNSVCFVATINEIKNIEGADNIQLGVIGGWNCIIKKDSHKVGDLVICATTDAVIPQTLSDNLGVTNYLRKGGRVRTIKLKGVYSECLIIPLSVLVGKVKTIQTTFDGMDCMEVLEIFKYEPPIKQITLASGRKIKWRDNQNFHIYYKFPNLKNVQGMFTESDEVQITSKRHGTNSRFGICLKSKLSILDKIKLYLNTNLGIGGSKWKWVNYEFVVGSHNCEKGSDSNGYYDKNVWFDIEKKYNIKNKLWDLVKEDEYVGSGLVLYGEIFGPGIQKNYDYGLKEIIFEAFDITIDGMYVSPFSTEIICSDFIKLPHVPILYKGKWSQEIQDSFTFNRFIPGTKLPEEGIVIKINTGERNKVAKVINPDYLIYSEKHNVEDNH